LRSHFAKQSCANAVYDGAVSVCSGVRPSQIDLYQNGYKRITHITPHNRKKLF